MAALRWNWMCVCAGYLVCFYWRCCCGYIMEEVEMNAPCYECKDRTLGCHGSCEKYAEYDSLNKKRIHDHSEEIRTAPEKMPNSYLTRNSKLSARLQKEGRRRW